MIEPVASMVLNRPSQQSGITDTELLLLFKQEPEQAWGLFCERYSDFIFTVLRRMGFVYDDAMDRFVFICEKLSEQDYRRLRSIKYAGVSGDISPWLSQVIKRLCVNWAWSENGRKRLLNIIAEMPPRTQRVFKLYFWQGQTPLEIYETLRLEHDSEVNSTDVFDALEAIFEHLSQKKLWRLLSNLNRMRKTFSLDQENEETGLRLEPIDANSVNAEETLQQKETSIKLVRALKELSTGELLVVQFRYEEGMTLSQVAAMLGWEERKAVNLHKSALYKLRKVL